MSRPPLKKAATPPPSATGEPQTEIILYQAEDGKTKIEVRLVDDTVWLTQAQMADLFQTSVPNVSIHIRNVFEEKELQQDSVV
jgi:hypothetical protein